MFSVDSTPLDNPDLGWVLRAPSKPISDLTIPRVTVRTPGVPGVVPGISGDLDAPQLPFMVETPRENLEALLALWQYGALLSPTDAVGKVAPYELLSLSHEGYGDADAVVDVTATVRIPGVFWRDRDESTTAAVPVDAASVFVSAWAGQSGITADAVVRVKGPVGGLQVRSGASWFSYAASVPAGSYLRFHADTGQAYLTGTDTWTGGTDVTGQVDFDGPGGRFAVYPNFTTPTTRTGRVEVTTISRAAGAQAELRGKGAYLVF